MGANLRTRSARRALSQASFRDVPAGQPPGRVGDSRRRGLILGLTLVFSAFGASPAGWAATDESQGEAAPGRYDIGVSTRTFDQPLFGSGSTTTFRLYGNQSFPGSGDYYGWLNGGFPDHDTWFGVTGENLRAGSATLGFTAGDLSTRSLQPRAIGQQLADDYALQGAGVGVETAAGRCNVFAGRSRYRQEVPGLTESRPSLFGADCLSGDGQNIFGVGLTAVADPTYVVSDLEGTATVLNGRYYRRTGARSHAFGQLLGTFDGGIGFRAGTQHEMFHGSVAAAVYSFGDEFPYVNPLYRPGESGVDFRGNWQPSGQVSLYGNLNYVADDRVTRRSELRGTIGAGMNLGPSWPHLSFDYTHNDVVYDTLTDSDRSAIGRRLSATASLNGNYRYLGLTLEQVFGSGSDSTDRTQALLSYRQTLTANGVIDGSAVLQREGSDALGITAESAVELPLAGRYNYLVGLGLAWIDRATTTSGEGALRLGLSRRSFRNGWYGRIEVRLPFSIGVPRSSLARQVFALDVGNRFNWKDVRQFAPLRRKQVAGHGAIEGTVTLDGVGIGGIGILIDGERLATSRSDGSYSIRGVVPGSVSVSADLRGLGPEYDVAGPTGRLIHTEARIVSRADLRIERFALFQGALVRCEGDRVRAIVGVDVVLDGGESGRTVRTSTSGAFQFDRITPGIYEFQVPGSGDSPPRRFRVDLSEDIYGVLLRVGCAGEVSTDPGVSAIAGD